MWVMIILFVVVVFEGCFLVQYFTRFTEEVFGCVVSFIFIYEALSYLVKVRIIFCMLRSHSLLLLFFECNKLHTVASSLATFFNYNFIIVLIFCRCLKQTH